MPQGLPANTVPLHPCSDRGKCPPPTTNPPAKMQTQASIVVDKAAKLANGSTILPVKTHAGAPLTWMSENYLRVLWKPAPHPEARDPKRATISLEIDSETKQHFENLEAEVQKQIPSQTLPNSKYLTSYELRDRWRSCLKQTQRGTEYLKAKINFGKARFFEDFQPTKATPEDLENRTIRVVLRVLVWVAPAQVGLSLEVSDVMPEDDLSCPFVAA